MSPETCSKRLLTVFRTGYCGNGLANSSASAPLSDCNIICAGNPYEYCGAGDRLELYSDATGPITGPSAPATIGDFTFVGCWTEGDGVRALSGASYSNATNMTLENCASFCTGFEYFGAEYGSQCYCGDILDPTSSAAPLSDCNMVCSGDADEYCGAGNRLELYNNTALAGPGQPATVGDYVYYGCYTEATDGRALAADSFSANNMTLEACAAFCSGYPFFGAEYAEQCFCGNALAEGSVTAPQSDCDMVCTGNSAEFCGAGNLLSVYTLA